MDGLEGLCSHFFPPHHPSLQEMTVLYLFGAIKELLFTTLEEINDVTQFQTDNTRHKKELG